MEAVMLRNLADKAYERRKNTALELERVIKDCVTIDDVKRLELIIGELCTLVESHNSHARSGGIMGLAGTSIALGPKVAEHLAALVPPVLRCFADQDSKVRYFACESMYNITKVAKGEILIYFNELFDAMSRLAADTEISVKNGAELLDRLVKDVVTEQASTYVSTLNIPPSQPLFPNTSDRPGSPPLGDTRDTKDQSEPEPQHAFSLKRFVPLLRERIYVINPFTRTYLVSWLTVLDSVPELELVTYLPEFLDGLLKFLGDPTVDIRIATQNVLADFLREIREVAEVQKFHQIEESKLEQERAAPKAESSAGVRAESSSRTHSPRTSQLSGMTKVGGVPGDSTVPTPTFPESLQGLQIEGAASGKPRGPNEEEGSEEDYDDEDDDDSGEWIPGQGVHVDHAAIIEILLEHLTFPDEEIQATCLRWIAEFLIFVQPVMVPFAPRLIPVILSSLAHHVPTIRNAANETNDNLFSVIQALPVAGPSSPQPPTNTGLLATSASAAPTRSGDLNKDRNITSSPPTNMSFPDDQRSRSSMSDYPPIGAAPEMDPFDYGATVNALTLQFLNEHEETRVAALEWLIMLHQKAPRRILAIDDPAGESSRIPSRIRTHPAYSTGSSESGLSIALLLKMLSDASERVLRMDLQLLAQISASAADEYFPTFMMSLLELFSTDRKLLETRGSLIIRQLCASLNTERIYRTFAEILEKDEDLEFASIMVQNLNLIMITSPELAEFRKRLKSLDTKDGQSLFVALYRSWSHNAVATFSLCLLAQTYEQACALLQILWVQQIGRLGNTMQLTLPDPIPHSAELEITVSMLIQIDKLVQLLESPVFTSLRLQLLEPDRYPYLLKAMYGLLMLLPQSSAFATLRNRLSAVSTLGFLQTVPNMNPSNTSSSSSSSANTINASRLRRQDDVRWSELLYHFRAVQKRRATAAMQGHELGFDPPFNTSFSTMGSSTTNAWGSQPLTPNSGGGGPNGMGSMRGASGGAGGGAQGGRNGTVGSTSRKGTGTSTSSTAGGGGFGMGRSSSRPPPMLTNSSGMMTRPMSPTSVGVNKRRVVSGGMGANLKR
ncbi:BZ3500_MvSof-1268-A1-R1_Chr5-3g08147 [Microbotryum saponariae]|uniref:BZ3500_MvSof-1268-A1-R1_Chr5-3g08147 protein n=1 Tax=Microbotryum saponariae TaxID=289078 RepID=A0A2X0MI01_9BASI|nr:BZ3500_MvSof-1268-A1-R1_Chr5-3g08147 [Microbotryum saponariae]SDA07906.1 BZ3501_MvSof-1269-A2-R1_Chr5-1g07291 [Microbotryum saponariae]